MYILCFVQENEQDLAMFDSLDNMKKFVKKLPSVEYEEDEFGFSASINPKNIPDYIEIEYKNNLFPISKFMFDSENIINIYYKEIPNLDNGNSGMVNSFSNIDNYMIENNELKKYITLRENVCRLAINALKSKGCVAERAYAGSEDGEAVIYKKQTENDWRFLFHLDPAILNEFENLSDEDITKKILDTLA